jgi:glyoxylase-like metal-dependent hydrolase (beta-lactamase superfamily II)
VPADQRHTSLADGEKERVAVYEIKVLDLMDVDVESSFLVFAHDIGVVTRAKTWAYLLLGGDDVILVDSGASNPEIMGRLGMTGYTAEEQRLENQLARHGVRVEDVRWILHTHTHIDHAGQDDCFPAATVVMNRRELEFSASGLMGAQYPPEYVKHHIDRLHTPGALRLLDLDLSGPDEILPGIVCEMTGGHTEGSMNILVETAGGTACLCGDIMYDVHNAIVEPYHVALDREPQVTGNHAMTKRQEKAAIKKALNSGRFLLTGHDYPARVEHGRVVERIAGDTIPGPGIPIADWIKPETKEAAEHLA